MERNGKVRTRHCRICAGKTEVFLDFGEMPPGNGFLVPGSGDPRFPFAMAKCEECHLVQVDKPMPAEVIEKVYRNYRYVPTGATLSKHYIELGEEIAIIPPRRARCLDIGSNSGILLSTMKRAGNDLQIQGIEPAEDIAEKARASGVPTMTGFFDTDNAVRLLAGGAYDCVSMTQVFQHLQDPVKTLFLIRGLTKDVSTLIVEGRDILATIRSGAWDSHYQELLFEYGALSLCSLMERTGFQPFAAKRDPVYGGSLRIMADKVPRADSFPIQEVKKVEIEAGLDRFETYEYYGRRAIDSSQEIREAVVGLGGKTAVFGAPSTGVTLLNSCRLTSKEIGFAVDDSVLKQGLLIPGTGIEIRNPNEITESKPDNVMVVPWRLREDILSRLRAIGFRGKAIVPLPKLEVVELS